MNQEKEDEIFCKRLGELARQAYTRGICTYSSFLNLNELGLFYKTINTTSQASYELWGGYKEAERRVICFYDSDSFPHISFPILCLAVEPRSIKFGENLSHRDYLGAILNLGIERSKIGDIQIQDKKAYVFCSQEIAPYVCENLERVRHTDVQARIVEFEDTGYKIETETVSGTVSSIRLDSLLAFAFRASRSSLTGLIAGGKVFVNGRNILSNSFVPKEEDIISVRGMGRFVFKGIESQTKKDRYRITIEKYQ